MGTAVARATHMRTVTYAADGRVCHVIGEPDRGPIEVTDDVCEALGADQFEVTVQAVQTDAWPRG